MAALKKLSIGINLTVEGKSKSYEGRDAAEAASFIKKNANGTVDAISINMSGATSTGETRAFATNVSALDADGKVRVASAVGEAKNWLNEHGGGGKD